MKKTAACLMLAFAAWVIVVQFLEAAAPTYAVTAKFPIAGNGGWDYLTIDPRARLLYIAHATQVQLFDLDQKKIVGAIANTPGVHGIALAPGLDRGFVSDGRDNTVTMFDLKTHRTLGKIAVGGQNPDAIVFDPASDKVFTMNGGSKDASVIDARSAKVIGHIALGGRPEFAVADGSGTLFGNLEDQSQLVAIDTSKDVVRHRWPLAPCEEPSSMAIDAAHRRLFIGCRNRTLVVVDADKGSVIASLPIGGHVDATAFDPGKSLIFSANGDGTLTIVHQDTPDRYHVVENVTTQLGARTLALDDRTHALYLVTARFGAPPASTAQYPHPRPTIEPGSFMLLMVAPSPDGP